jgi:hypothetical protein
VSRGEGELLTVPKPRAVRLLSVYLAVKPVGEPDAGDRHVRSGDGKRSVAEWPKLPRPSSTLPFETCRPMPPRSVHRGRPEVTGFAPGPLISKIVPSGQ